MLIDFNKKINPVIIDPDVVLETDKEPKRRGRPPKRESVNNLVEGTSDLPKVATNEPYKNEYCETNNMLRTAVMQIDDLSCKLSSEIDTTFKTRSKGRQNYLAELSSTYTALISTKISAVREMNKTITDVNNLELRRTKELKLNVDTNDDKHIQDMYNAFINTPQGTATNILPSVTDYINPSEQLSAIAIGSPQQSVPQFNPSPEQQRMLLENNPNVKTVVVFDQTTGTKSFDVIDISTGQSIQGVPRPSGILLDDMTVNTRNCMARNANFNVDFPVVLIGSDSLDTRY